MKKLLLLFVALILICTGCTNQNDNTSFDLKGKTFAAYNYTGPDFFGSGEYDVYKVWRFISSDELEQTARENSPSGKIIGDIERGLQGRHIHY